MQQQTHLTSNKIPRQPKKIWKQVLLRKTEDKLDLNCLTIVGVPEIRGRGKICLEKVGAHVLLLLSRKVRKDLIMFVTQLVNSSMNRPKRIRNRTLRLAKKCRIRIWKQPFALDKNFHLTSLGHKKLVKRLKHD